MRVVLAGPEPEFLKVPRAFNDIDPVSFVIASDPKEVIAALDARGALLVAVDLTLPEPVTLAILEACRRVKVRVLIGVSRRDSPPLRRRVERMSLDHAVFQRRPRNALIEVVKNLIQYEIRQAPRAVMANLVRVATGTEVIEGEAVNVSATGMLVLMPRLLEMGQSISSLSFDLPGRGHRVVASGRVARLLDHAAGFLTGFRFEAISETDRRQIRTYIERTLEPPDVRIDPLHRARRASRSSATGLSKLKAVVTSTTAPRRDYFRVRDVSEAGAFLFPRVPFETPVKVGSSISIVFAFGGGSVAVSATVQRVVLHNSLEGKLFPNGFAVEFTEPGISREDLDRIVRG